ncbi:DsbA family protein [Actinoplanes flavus]|uniref:Thioredoxin domain-containing protein n=1 Tax=Actinoplanes flavus TaxID=2820290 RepID=A0ABS3UCT5_9ACTN|nr:thioredoxin domain-containing protein [Actinoplanes flavus]MBO3736580.1 thioredoxin domain-containing protein [Actinoplanes flavus]
MGKQARLKSREVRKAQAAIAAQRKSPINVVTWIGGLVIVGLLIAIVAVVVNATRDAKGSDGKLVNPANLTASEALLVGQASAPVTVEIYLDYMCPACGRFETTNAAELDRLIDAKTINLELRPMNFLDKQSQGSRYSTRAANAVATVADQAPDKVWAFTKALYANQPEEGTTGLSDQAIADLAVQAGVAQTVADRFKDRTFDAWVTESNDDAFEAGVTGTPTVKINGTKFEGDVYTVGPLTQAIEQAAGGAK